MTKPLHSGLVGSTSGDPAAVSQGMSPLGDCACGCGEPVRPGRRYRKGHNLNGRTTSTPASWPPGASPALRNGLRSRRPPKVVISPIVAEIEEALGADLPLKDAAGGVPAPDRFAVELAAIALLRVRRCWAFLELRGDQDERGNLRPEVDGLGRAVEHAARMLDRLGCSPRARAALGLDVARVAQFDLAQHWAAEDAAEVAVLDGPGHEEKELGDA